MKRRDWLLKSFTMAAGFTCLGQVESKIQNVEKEQKKLYQVTFKFNLPKAMSLEEYLELEKNFQSNELKAINTSFKKSGKILEMKFEFFEKVCIARYLFASENDYHSWHDQIKAVNAVDQSRRRSHGIVMTVESSEIIIG